MNVLKSQEQQDLLALVRAKYSFREIEERLGMRRETVSKYAGMAGLWPPAQESKAASGIEVATGSEAKTGQSSPGWPPAGGALVVPKIPKHARSACDPYRDWIEGEVRKKRNAMSIYQDLVELFGFTHRYNSVKRFVRGLRRQDPAQFDRLEFLPGEEAQVDYGTGALTRHPVSGKYRRPRLFVMTLKYSRKSFRKVVWHSSQEIWARLHEEAFRYFGGCPQYVVLDNLKEGVITPDIYEPLLNAVYAAMLKHYGVVADPARVQDPDRKGTVENAIQHTQGTALKGRRFESIEEQNVWLMHWEERWAAPRIHGRVKRQVLAMFLEEKPHLKPLPLMSFRYFKQETRTVQEDGLIQVGNSFYAALPLPLYSSAVVRIYDNEIEILNPSTLELVRRHSKTRVGKISWGPDDRIMNPSRQTGQLLEQASRIGPSTRKLCELLFDGFGRVGNRKMRGVISLARKFPAATIEMASKLALERGVRSSRVVRSIVEKMSELKPSLPALTQTHALIRPVIDYGTFWRLHAAAHQQTIQKEEIIHANVHARNRECP